MAISYSLELATQSSAEQVARELHAFADVLGEPTADHGLLDGTATRHGTWIRVVKHNPPEWHAVVTDLGFTPEVMVVFRLDKDSDSGPQQDDMIRVVSGLLNHVSGDAVLHFQLEIIWLLRRDGELTLNERDDLWPPERLALLSQPYRRATYSFS